MLYLRKTLCNHWVTAVGLGQLLVEAVGWRLSHASSIRLILLLKSSNREYQEAYDDELLQRQR